MKEDKFIIATVYDTGSSGTRLIFDGEASPTEKRYKKIAGSQLTAGQRVLCIRKSGSIIIIGGMTR